MRKQLTLLLILSLLILVSFANSHAETSWLPQYDSSKTVFLAPAFDRPFTQSVESGSVESEVRQLGAKHNLKVYVIATQKMHLVTRRGPLSFGDSGQSGLISRLSIKIAL